MESGSYRACGTDAVNDADIVDEPHAYSIAPRLPPRFRTTTVSSSTCDGVGANGPQRVGLRQAPPLPGRH